MVRVLDHSNVINNCYVYAFMADTLKDVEGKSGTIDLERSWVKLREVLLKITQDSQNERHRR